MRGERKIQFIQHKAKRHFAGNELEANKETKTTTPIKNGDSNIIICVSASTFISNGFLFI